MKSLVVSDSIQETKESKKCKKIRTIPVAPLIAQAMLNISQKSSVSSLFKSETLEPIYEAHYPVKS